MNTMTKETKKLPFRFLKAKNIQSKPPEMVPDNFSGLDNVDPMVNGLASTRIFLRLKELNTLTKFTLQPSTTTTHTTWIIPPSNETCSSTTIKTISPKETTTGASNENVLTSVPLSTSPTLLERRLTSLLLWSLVLTVLTITIFLK